MRILTCLTDMHDPWLVAVAAFLCAAGSWASYDLFLRYRQASRDARDAGMWLFLAATSAGVTAWCTHFVAMLAFDPGASTTFAVAPTFGSLFIAGFGFASAFAAGAARPLLGGAIAGAAVSAMHYTGMAGYSIDAPVTWNMAYVVPSVLLAMGIGAASFRFAPRGRGWPQACGAALLAASVIALHFTGMAGLEVEGTAAALAAWEAPDITSLALAASAIGATVVALALAAGRIDARAARAQAEAMTALAMTDQLTGLPNRAHFALRLAESVAGAGPGPGSPLCVIAIDLDHFKEINDLRGHGAGDEALREVSRRMSSVLADGEFLARLGGDEFALTCAAADEAAALEVAARLRRALVRPLRLSDGGEAVVDGCFGIALHPRDGETGQDLMGNADLAMYRAKSLPMEHAVCYRPEMDEAVRLRRQTVADLRLALAAGQFEIHYQVQERVDSKQVTGHEALLRWHHPSRGLVPPGDFIPAAEESGLIIEIGEWVLRQACRDAAARPDLGKVAVNVSAVQFAHRDLPAMVSAALRDAGLAPSRLEVELTESVIMSDPERNMDILRRMQEMGVSVAMDDFGTGYSSLSTLRSFAFDKIKMDRSFMREAGSNEQAKAVIRAVLALGSSLGIPVLAEGVETEEQLEFLRREGCTEAQGYLLGRPARLESGAAVTAA